MPSLITARARRAIRRFRDGDKPKTVFLKKRLDPDGPRPSKNYVVLQLGPGGSVYSKVEDALRKPEVKRSFKNASVIIKLQNEIDEVAADRDVG